MNQPMPHYDNPPPQNGPPQGNGYPPQGNPPPQGNGYPPQGNPPPPNNGYPQQNNPAPNPPPLRSCPPTNTGQPPAASPPPQGTQPANGNDARQYESLHVYGGKAALCFDADSTKNGFPTVAIDGAVATAPRNYDWGNKIRIQLTKQELPMVAAVLIGAQPQCTFKSHGPQKDKGIELVRQDGGKIYIKVFGGNGQGVRGVPVMPSDLFYVTSLVLRQLLASMPGGNINDVLALLWATQSVPR